MTIIVAPGTTGAGCAAYDYIVVGSGAGGGPLAARLARRGFRVLVIEAGPGDPDGRRPDGAPESTVVPSLNALASEEPDVSWQFFVEHYDRPPAGPDPKRYPPAGETPTDPARAGIYYPRAAGLGGCTIHNAMITVAGPDSDWDDLATFLGDESWRSDRMRGYFQRVEHNEYVDPPDPLPRPFWARLRDGLAWLFGFEVDYDRGRHGFGGWLHTTTADADLAKNDHQLVGLITAAGKQAIASGLERASTAARDVLAGDVKRHLDPNHALTQAESPQGVVLLPAAVNGPATPARRGWRSSPRELIQEVRAEAPDRLEVWTDCLVTRILFDVAGDVPRAVGVEYRKGRHLYRAHVAPADAPGEEGRVLVEPGGEVVLCGGAFNTPQLLMLSGIGDTAHLSQTADRAGDPDACTLRGRDSEVLRDAEGRPRRVHRPGVGLNLQDRYEISLVSETERDLSVLDGATFRTPGPGEHPDPVLRRWRGDGSGLYASNGPVLGVFKRSRPDLDQPDLFIFGMPIPFPGYEVGYSQFGDNHRSFTWAILKAHTQSRGGTVRLRGADPRDTPLINFHYFNELARPGQQADDPDLLALVDGVKFVRGITRRAAGVVRREVRPGIQAVPTDDESAIKQWILREAWGHHACGTCRLGPDGDDGAVLDTRFRVRGVAGLRVVDASIFPSIPGYFIVTNIYMASEKAADVLAEDARGAEPDAPEYPRSLRQIEADAIAARRAAAGGGEAAGDPPPVAAGPSTWDPSVTGLALSGGGLRSATFGLGVLQAFAAGGALRRFDLLSTVGGGGFVGAFLGRFYDRLRTDPLRAAGGRPSRPPVSRVEQGLTDPASPEVDWLRRQSTYLQPTGPDDLRLKSAQAVRNLLIVHLLVGALAFTAFGLADALLYGVFDPATAGLGFVGVPEGSMPIGYLARAALGPFFSPWFVAFEWLVLFLVLPRVVAYWLVSDDRHGRFQVPQLAALFVVATSCLGLGLYFGLMPGLVALGLALFSSLLHVELAWHREDLREDAHGTGGPATPGARVRNYLTYDLGLYVALAAGLLGFALVDTVGHGLQQLAEGNRVYVEAFATLLGLAAAAALLLRFTAGWVAGRRRGHRTGPHARRQLAAGLFALGLLGVLLVVVSFTAHAAYRGGSSIAHGLVATGLAAAVSVVLAHPRALGLVNQSSLAYDYAARLARAYLGATNPARRRPNGGDVTATVPGDDVATVRDYRPHEAGGPLHLINLTVDQTVDPETLRGNHSRPAENLAVSALALSVGRVWHAAWSGPADSGPRSALAPLDDHLGTGHPLVDAAGAPTTRAEALPLRQWIAVSGTATGPGPGLAARLGTALLCGVANLRSGTWWDSGVAVPPRSRFPRLTFTRRLLYLIPHLFTTQRLLLSEWVATFVGPWRRFWHLSDGDGFDVLGGYELIRRRVPRIVLVDASDDPHGRLDGLAELSRKVRVDFGAEVEPVSAAELDQMVRAGDLSAEVRRALGVGPDLAAEPGRGGRAFPASHAALFRVEYATGPRRPSLLLLLRASLTGDEGTDLLQYHAAHPTFPTTHDPDGPFDESAWESYRRLGEHVANGVLADPGWFWAYPLEAVELMKT